MKKKYKLIISASILSLLFVLPLNTTTKTETQDGIIIETTDDITKAGTYFVKTRLDTHSNQQMDHTVRIHVKYPKTVLDYIKEEGIDAHDLVMTPEQIKDLTKDNLIHYGGAHAWSMIDGTEIDVTQAEQVKPTGDFAHTDIRYATERNTATQVSVYAQEEINLEMEETYINYNMVFKNKFFLLSLLVLVLTIFPILIYVLMFVYIQRKQKETQDFLYK